jgi:hypothetical protein
MNKTSISLVLISIILILSAAAAPDIPSDKARINPGATEVCDGKDNNGNGLTDENVKNLCYNYTDCQVYETCSQCTSAPAELCDDQDNNCNGNIDEGCSCTSGQTKKCGITDIGTCRKGIQFCQNGAWGECQDSMGPSAEICDNMDNNCNEQIDEDVCLKIMDINVSAPHLRKNTITLVIIASYALLLVGATLFFLVRGKKHSINSDKEIPVKKYILRNIKKGFTKEQINTRLKKSGWRQEHLDRIYKKLKIK